MKRAVTGNRIAPMAGILLMVFVSVGYAADGSDLESLKREIENLKRDNEEIHKTNATLAEKLHPLADSAQYVVDSKYGPNAPVTSKTGKLSMNGLVQVWYYTIQKDHNGLFNDPNRNGIADSNYGVDTDSFRVRRTELRFNFDLNEYITTEVMFDPAREATSFPTLPDNQANSSIFKRLTNTNIANFQTGAGAVPRILQNAWIDYHDFVPHHDFKIGQFKPLFGEEGIRTSGELDFVERSMVGQLNDFRDLGINVHGEWWGGDGKGAGRFQYWLGATDSPGNFHESAGQQQNRVDDNSYKDFVYRALVRPLWKKDTWGSLELGWSQQFGVHGGDGASDPVDTPLSGLNRRRTWANRMDAWGYYAPGGLARGLWFRSEWEWQKDRNAPQQVIDILGQGNAGDGSTQTNGKPFVTQGYYIAGAYNFGDSALNTPCSRLPTWARNLEVLFRYERYQNVQIADALRPDHTDVYFTGVYTGGINYYLNGKATKIQLNYNVLNNPVVNTADVHFHNVRNNILVVNFQVAW